MAIVVDLDAANKAKPMEFTADQKDKLAMVLRALPHIKVQEADAQRRVDAIKAALTPEQTKAVEAAASSRKGAATEAAYKEALGRNLQAIGAGR